MGGLSLGSAVCCCMIGDLIIIIFFPLRQKGTVYRSYVRPTTLHGSEA